MAGGMGGPGMGPPGYKAAWYPTQRVEGASTSLGFVRQGLNVGYPIYRDDCDTLLVTAGVRNTLFSTDAILPDSGQPFPDQLWIVNFGLMHLHRFDNGWSAGISGTFGSASDQPFHSLYEMNLGVFAFLKIPVYEQRDAWLFSLMYSPVGNFTFPLPGIAYSWKPSDDLHMSIGLPFSIRWRLMEDLTFTYFYVPVVNMNARLTYEVNSAWSGYLGFDWLNEAYFLADRTNRQDRFFAFEKRLLGGVRWNFWSRAALDLHGGYAFDRYYGEGESQLSPLSDRVDVEPGPFLGANLQLRW
jgi:hypothetical protein